jgi:thioredoxin reductase (NADPH)
MIENKGSEQTINCDVLILGAGPAGITAAIYTSRSKLNTILIDTNVSGGQVATTYHVANYPGTDGVVNGFDLMENMKKQAISFGCQLFEMQNIKEIDLTSDIKRVKTETNIFFSKTIFIATGSEPRKLPAAGSDEFKGRGVHYCATCDAAFYQDADVLVVGGGTSALQEALFLKRYAKTVTIVNRSDKFKAPKSSIDEALSDGFIKVLWNASIIEINGDKFVTSVVLEDSKANKKWEQKIDGIFVYIGTLPNTKMFESQINMTNYGYIITDNNMATNVKGVYAIGDVRDKEIRQITTAVGDGTIAGIMAEKYINK